MWVDIPDRGQNQGIPVYLNVIAIIGGPPCHNYFSGFKNPSDSILISILPKTQQGFNPREEGPRLATK